MAMTQSEKDALDKRVTNFKAQRLFEDATFDKAFHTVMDEQVTTAATAEKSAS
jgi:hypothetical protein